MACIVPADLAGVGSGYVWPGSNVELRGLGYGYGPPPSSITALAAAAAAAKPC